VPDFTIKFRSEPTDVGGGLVLDLDGRDLGDITVGQPIQYWPNRVTGKPRAEQNTLAKRPLKINDGPFDFQGASFNLASVLDHHMTFGGGDLISTPSEITAVFVFNALEGSPSTSQRLLENDGPDLTFAHLDASGDVAYRDSGGFVSPTSGISGTQILTYRLAGGGGAIYRDGALLGSGSYTPGALTDPTLCASASRTTHFFRGNLFKAMAWTRPLETAEIDLVHQRLAEAYDIALATPVTESHTTAELAIWKDHELGANPPRINPADGHPHKYVRAIVGSYLQLAAVVNGVEAPMDSELGGRLFTSWVVEYPTPYEPPIVSPAGQSSLIDVRLDVEGHYTIMVRREGGGGCLLHVDARLT
jgi:hypothetical protein